MTQRALYLLSLVTFPGLVFGQVVINEISPKNGSVVQDDEGDTPDWIELYNSGTSPVNLEGYWLTNTSDTLDKWEFPNVTPDIIIQPGGYYSVFASGKDRPSKIDHWETAVKAEDMWRYLIPSGPVPGWRQIIFDDSGWPQGPGGIGYGDWDDSTDIGGPETTIYMRKAFTISDTSKLMKMTFHMDFDDGFVAYINGYAFAAQEIDPFPNWDRLAYADHEAQFYQNPVQESFYEISYTKEQFQGALIPGTNVLTVEVHNVSDTSNDLSAIPYLHFAISDTNTYFNPTPSWFYAGESWTHTNFTLEGTGASHIYLSDPIPVAIDQMQYTNMQVDHSTGRQPDGSGNVVLFGKPTPDSTNNAATSYTGYEVDPIFNLLAGFYTGSQSLTITTPFSSGAVYYTFDGQIPDQSSLLYTGPVLIDSTVVVKARTFSTGLLPSRVTVGTYFIDESVSSTLPVVSVSTDPFLLWDYNKGIYVMGPNAEAWVPYFGANFWKPIEIPVNIEYFDKQRVRQLDEQVGAKIFGNWSRSNPQKSFKFIARGKYGKLRMDYQFFKEKDLHSFKQIVLRDAGNDFNRAHFRDALIQQVSYKNTEVDVQGYQPCVMFLNGEYWGVYNIREKINEYMVADNHDMNPDDIDLLEYNNSIMAGSNTDWESLYQFVINNAMDSLANFATAASRLDMDNFTDYFIVQTWCNNWDWLTNNVRFWRNNRTNSKWRYIMWDLDLGVGATWPFFANGLDTNLNKQWDVHSLMMQSLLVNDTFRHHFINRYADLLNTILAPSYFNQWVDDFRDTIMPEMPSHFATWGWPFYNPDWGNPGQSSYNQWINSSVQQVKDFVNYRQQTARDHVQQQFILDKQVPVTLNVSPPGAGKIHINTVDIESFPWAGIYYDSVPVTITAVPNPGYEFSFWQSNIYIPNPDTNLSQWIHVDTSDAFTAYFFGAPDTPVITINEINYNSHSTLDAGDWVELYNYGTWPFDLSGWRFKDSLDANKYVFPEGTIVQPNGYLVVVQDTAKFDSIYPNISNIAGPFNFNLQSLGEKLRLMDDCLNEYISVTYSISLPWPQEPNGQGNTLELLNPSNDIDDVNNWFKGCILGSPGGPFVPCITGVKENAGVLNGGYNLVNYPNPFTGNTTIVFSLQQDEKINLAVYDIYGRSVTVLASGEMKKGKHLIQFNSGDLSAGIYFLRLTCNAGAETRVMQIR